MSSNATFKHSRILHWLLASAVVLVGRTSAEAAIVNLPGLNTVRVWETTGLPVQHNFLSNGFAMFTQLGVGTLGPVTRDFDGLGNENYDVFYSDANGALNPNGNYVTVEAVYPNPNGGGGLNLAAVDLLGSFGVLRADVLTSWVGLGPNYLPATVPFSVDVDTPVPSTWTTMGSTVIPPAAHLRVTVGWSGIPEPGSACLVATAVVASLGTLGRFRARRPMI